MIEWNARRLAVLDRDTQAIIGTHPRDTKVPAWLVDAAEALEKIGEIDLAFDWAKQATDFDRGTVAQGRPILVKPVGQASAGRAAPRPSVGVPAVAVLWHRRPPLPGIRSRRPALK